MRRPTLVTVLCVAVLSVVSALSILAGPVQAKPLKVAFALLGTVNDQGWNHSHFLGIQQLQKELGDAVEVSWAENVKAADAERVFRQYAQDGYDLIFGTTFEHMDPMLQVAKDFPSVSFEHCSGYKTAPNMGTYMGALEQAEYLAGYMSGLMGYKNVGTVATNPIPEPVRGINAFVNGQARGLTEAGVSFDAKKINTVVWLKSWRDPAGETTLAETLVQRGHDLIRQMADTPDASLAACARNVPAIGYGADPAGFGAKCVLVSTVWNWGRFYVDLVNAKLSGTWKAQELYWGLDKGGWQLSAFNDKVPAAVRDKVLKELDLMKQGVDNSFKGPVFNQQGKVVIPEGQKASMKELMTMHWLAQGVSGSLPE